MKTGSSVENYYYCAQILIENCDYKIFCSSNCQDIVDINMNWTVRKN